MAEALDKTPAEDDTTNRTIKSLYRGSDESELNTVDAPYGGTEHPLSETANGGRREHRRSDSVYGYSDQIIDPYCEICRNASEKMVEAKGLCRNCNSFLCKPCILTHRLQIETKRHRILKGEKMPKSMSDKPVKYIECTCHENHFCDQFCLDHSEMICRHCIFYIHYRCRTNAIDVLCKNLDQADIRNFKSVIGTMGESLTTAKITMETNLNYIDEQEQEMIQDAKIQRDKLITLVQHHFADSKIEIRKTCLDKRTKIAETINLLTEMQQALDESVKDVDKNVDIYFGPNQFIKMQQIAEEVRQTKAEILNISKRRLHTTHLSFCSKFEIEEFKAFYDKLGNVDEVLLYIDFPDSTIQPAFPVEPYSKYDAKPVQHDIDNHAVKLNPRCTKLLSDDKDCVNMGCDVACNSTLLVADAGNNKVKAISRKHPISVALTFPWTPDIITVVDEGIAVVASDYGNDIMIIDISNINAVNIRNSIPCDHGVKDLASFDGKIVLLCYGSRYPVLKVIDLDGKEIWSVSTQQKPFLIGLKRNKALFDHPSAIATRTVEGKTEVIVADRQTITVVQAETGEVLRSIGTEESIAQNSVRSITSDSDGNIYIACRDLSGYNIIAMISSDLEYCKTILSIYDLPCSPTCIAYDRNTRELQVSYNCCWWLCKDVCKRNMIDRFFLS